LIEYLRCPNLSFSLAAEGMRVDVLLRGIFFHRASNYVHYSPDAIILILDATGRVIKVYLVEVKAPYALRYILEKFDNEAGSTTWYQGPIRFPVYGYHALPGGVSWEAIGGRPLSPIDVSLAPLPPPHFAQTQLGMEVLRGNGYGASECLYVCQVESRGAASSQVIIVPYNAEFAK
jgi:hypothetical protein